MSTVDRSRHVPHGRLRVAATVLPLAVLIFGGGIGGGTALAAPDDQAGVTDSPSEQSGVSPQPRSDQQVGVTPRPAPAPPPRPQEQSPLGVVIPDPPQRDPGEYRDPPWVDNGDYSTSPPQPPQSAPQVEPAPWVEPEQPDVQVQWYDEPESSVPPQQSVPQRSEPEEPPATLGEDLGGLHAPVPVEPPKLLRPPPSNRLGFDPYSIESPLPPDATWEVNAHLAEAQATTDGWFRSIGISDNRATRMAVGAVGGAAIGGTAGFIVACVPAAVTTGAAGAIVGAGLGAAVGNVPGAVAGAGIGAAGGAAAGCVGAGIAGAAIGGAIGGAAGVIATAGDGSGLPERPQPAPVEPVPVEPAPVEPVPVEPAPEVYEQVQATVTATVDSAEGAVDWANEQPGGPAALETAADVVDTSVAAVQQQSWAPAAADAAAQAAQDAVAWAQTQAPIAEVTTAAVEVITDTPPLAPGQLGPFTDQVNAGLAGIQAAIGG